MQNTPLLNRTFPPFAKELEMWLKNRNYRVLVSPQGGSILGLWWQEHCILGPARMVRVGKELKARGETHWCYPNFGTVNPEVRPEYQQPKHGFLRHTLLNITHYSDNLAQFEAPSFSRNGLLKSGPFVDIALSSRGVWASLCAKNNGLEELPILPASHPYFAVPEGRGLEVKMGTEVLVAIYGAAAWGVNAKACVVERTGPVSVKLFGIGTVDLGLPDNCTHIVLWSDSPFDYVCVEPIFGTPGSYGTKEGRWLKPGEETKCEVQFLFTPA